MWVLLGLFLLIVAAKGLAGMSFETPAPKPNEHKVFVKYIAEHNCRRTDYGFGGPNYHCRNGMWNEKDLMDMAAGRYPN